VRPTLVAMATKVGLGAESSRLPACAVIASFEKVVLLPWFVSFSITQKVLDEITSHFSTG